MSIIGISKSEIQEHISDRDEFKTESEGATVWILGSLDVNVRARIGDRAMVMEQGEEGTRFFVQGGTRTIDTVRFGLKGWRNFKDDKGNQFVFVTRILVIAGEPYDVVTDECLGFIPPIVLNELAQKILEHNSLDPSAVGNSRMQSSPSNSGPNSTAKRASKKKG